MNAILRPSFCVALVCAFVAFAPQAQDSPAKPQVDYSHDPCGNPLTESQLWFSVKGMVLRVIAALFSVSVPNSTQSLRVHLVGVGLGNKEQSTAKAKGGLITIAVGQGHRDSRQSELEF